MYLAAGYQDGATALVEPVRNVHLVERGNDGAAVAFRDVREQDTVVGLFEPRTAGDDQRNHPRRPQTISQDLLSDCSIASRA